MNNQNRPQSPHFTIYRWPLSMTLSILHRMTGVALSVGFVVLMIWLLAIASGAVAYMEVQAQLQSGFGRLLLIGWSFAFFFHLSNGVRHLVWDAGRGFEKKQTRLSGFLVIIATVVLTLAYWLAL
jgi:succinate dehydrogenase / fumarate reductase cytochrome b subunit